MNDARYKLSEQELDDLDYLSTTHFNIKNKFQSILESTQMYPPSSDNEWHLKQQVEDLQKSSREVKNIYLDAKLLAKSADQFKVPEIKHFSDIVDELMFRFKDMKRTPLSIKKLSPNNYLFGTRKIQAKVHNGVLLIRVGGGYENIETFYANYGEAEI